MQISLLTCIEQISLDKTLVMRCFLFLSLKVNKRVPAQEDTAEWDAIRHGVCPSGRNVSVAGPTPSASGHTAHHVHAAQTPGGQLDHWPGAAPGETLFP